MCTTLAVKPPSSLRLSIIESKPITDRDFRCKLFKLLWLVPMRSLWLIFEFPDPIEEMSDRSSRAAARAFSESPVLVPQAEMAASAAVAPPMGGLCWLVASRLMVSVLGVALD